MIKVGFWNRLAIVAAGLILLIAPLWMLLDRLDDYQDYKEIEYDLCMADAEEALANGEAELYIETQQKCSNQRFSFDDPREPGWREWGLALAFTAIICGALYLLLWLTVWLAKWVWRGKSTA